jgi:hypothetical protein
MMQGEQPTAFDRGCAIYVLIVLGILFLGFGGLGGVLSEARAALQGASYRTGSTGYTGGGYTTARAPVATGPYSGQQTAAVLAAAPALLGTGAPPVEPAAPLAGGGGVGQGAAPAAPSSNPAPPGDPGACINGVNSYGIACGQEPDGVHYYPPAHPAEPCQQADGAIRFTRITATGNTEVFTLAPRWSGDRSTYSVVLPGGAAPVMFIGPPPACGP